MCNESNGEWTCKLCGAVVDAEFDACWKCGALSDGTPDPDFVPAVRSIREELHCKNCGCFLRGLPSNRCPECGTEFDPDAADTEPGQGASAAPAGNRTWSASLFAGLASLALAFGVAAVWGSCESDDSEFVFGDVVVLFVASLSVAALVSMLFLFLKHAPSRASGPSSTEAAADARREIDK